MRLAHAPQHDLVGLGVVLDAQRRVLGGEPLQPWAELVLVGLGPRLDRQRQQRLGHVPRPEDQRVVLVGEGVAGLGPGQLPDRADVARDDQVGRSLGLAERDRERADALVLVVVLVAGVLAEERREVAGDVHRGVGPDGAGEDPDQGDPADVRVRRRLDDLRDERAVGVARDR